MSWLLSISIGPVQSFIAAARKTRDLYAGSWIVSEVAKAAGLALSQGGAELIFPAASDQDLAPNSPFRSVNKILASTGSASPGTLAQAAKIAARARLLGLRHQLRGLGPVKVDANRLVAHLENTIEFYAAWAPLGENDGAYVAAHREVEAALIGRKASKCFDPHVGTVGYPKSSFDGGRETVITERGDSPSQNVWLRKGEQLDGPGFLKRFLSLAPEPRFASTIDIAALPYRLKLERVAQSNPHFIRLQALEEEARLDHRAGDLLFGQESRQIFPTDSPQDMELREIRNQLGAPAPPYYAILRADGDSVGERIAVLRRDQHKALARELSGFASRVRKTLLELDCMPVFAGGDDVLAFVPLHKLLEAAAAVRNEFAVVAEATGIPLTLSAGISIVHALNPLDEALSLASAAERRAKSVEKKNALAVLLSPRSGAPVEVAAPWNEMLPMLSEVESAYRSEDLSFGFAHDLVGLLAQTAFRGSMSVDRVLPEMAYALASKKARERKATPVLVAKYCPRHDPHPRERLELLVNCMLVARKIARAKKEAYG